MKYEIVELDQKLVEGILVNTTNEGGQSMLDIGTAWQRFFSEGYAKIEHKVNAKTIGLYADYEGDFTKPFHFISGAEVKEGSSNLGERVVKEIEKGRYAKFVICGNIQKELGEFWTRLWKMDLNRSYRTDFEEYQDTASNTQNQEIHIYIGIR